MDFFLLIAVPPEFCLATAKSVAGAASCLQHNRFTAQSQTVLLVRRVSDDDFLRNLAVGLDGGAAAVADGNPQHRAAYPFVFLLWTIILLALLPLERVFPKNSPERDLAGVVYARGRGRGRGRWVQKRAAATNCYSPFGGHYSRDVMLVLFQTLSNAVTLPGKRFPPRSSPAFSRCLRPSQNERRPADVRSHRRPWQRCSYTAPQSPHRP